MGFAIVGNPHTSDQQMDLAYAIRSLNDLQITASLCLSSEYIIQNVSFCRQAELTGMDWIANPFRNLLTETSSEAWTDDAIRDEAFAAVSLFQQCKLTPPIGLLLPDGTAGNRVHKILQDVNSQLPIYALDHRTTYSDQFGESKSISIHLMQTVSNPQNEHFGFAIDVEQLEFLDGVRLLAFYVQGLQTMSLMRFGDLGVKGVGQARPKRRRRK